VRIVTDVQLVTIVDGLDSPMVDRMMDECADLVTLADDVLDWSVGATISDGLVEFSLTIDVDDVPAGEARANEFVESVLASVMMAGRTKSRAGELVDA